MGVMAQLCDETGSEMGNDLYLEVRHFELQPNLLTKYKSVDLVNFL